MTFYLMINKHLGKNTAAKELLQGVHENNEKKATKTVNYSEIADDIFESARRDLMIKEVTGDYESYSSGGGLFDPEIKIVKTIVRVKYNSRFSNLSSSITSINSLEFRKTLFNPNESAFFITSYIDVSF